MATSGARCGSEDKSSGSLEVSIIRSKSDTPVHDNKHASAFGHTARSYGQDEEQGQPPEATDEEIKDLPHIKGKVPMATWILVVACASTNFARYGITAIFRKSRKCDLVRTLIDMYRELHPETPRQPFAARRFRSRSIEGDNDSVCLPLLLLCHSSTHEHPLGLPTWKIYHYDSEHGIFDDGLCLTHLDIDPTSA